MFRLLITLQMVFMAFAYRPLQPYVPKTMPIPAQGDPGEPLYLTEYINQGDLAGARAAAQVTGPLVGLSSAEQPESYAGFLTVNNATQHHMYFWFFPAMDVDPTTAPVVIWLQGGPGGSSMFGLLEIHGPIQAVYNGTDTTGVLNPFTWAKNANMLYIDNPVGAGYSYTGTGTYPTTQADVADDLYEALVQWFTIFEDYRGNPFYPFGESYAGKFVPTIARRIHDENTAGAAMQINLQGMGIGDGFMSPPDSSIYAEYLYQVALVDETMRDDLLVMEERMKNEASQGLWRAAWLTWNNEFATFMPALGCSDYYNIQNCEVDPEEDNYAAYMTEVNNRKSLHAGSLPFGDHSGDVYTSMIEDFMRSERDNIEFLLDRYRVLIYDGNMDIICNHAGILEMFEAMNTWSAIDEYRSTEKSVYTYQSQTVGYLKAVQNLRMFVMRNAGHMVPRNQPEYALDMFNKFIDGTL